MQEIAMLLFMPHPAMKGLEYALRLAGRGRTPYLESSLASAV